jgi:cell wall-associated NlpC family hydrolase
VVAALSAAILAATLIVLTPATAQADPNSVAQAQADVDRYAREASELEQQYDEVHIRLEAAQQEVDQTRADIEAQILQVADLKAQVAQIALQEWQSQGMSTTAVILVSENTAQVLNYLSTTQRLAQTTDDLIQRFQLEQADLNDKHQRVEALAEDIRQDNDRLAGLKAEAEGKLAQAREALTRLRAADARAAAARQVTQQQAVVTRTLVSDGTLGAAVANFAISKVGGPYVWGGNGPTGYDCSGLTRAAYLSVGVSLPHSSSGQFGYGVPVSLSELLPGDLVFYYSGISHVGVYVGGGMIVHASTYGVGIVYSPVSNAPVAGARRLV